MESWREMITEAMSYFNDSLEESQCTLSDKELDVKFDTGFGGDLGPAFTVWTEGRVYFPSQYDGSVACASVSRDNDGVPTNHVGGG